MSVFCLLLAFVPLLHDQAAGQAVCPNKTWDPIMDRQWDRCIYYCRDGRASWHIGFFYNGTKCRHTKPGDGRCREGYCYKATSNRSTRTPKRVGTTEGTTQTMPMTKATVTNGTTKKREKDKKTKTSSTLVPSSVTTTETITETVPSTESTATKDTKTEKRKKKKKPKKKDKKENKTDKKKKSKNTTTIVNIEW
uniref:Basic tail secreted protein n=1 Tax=Rhipicephalus appendiculatus TaxID=34631 RepID=A0A131YG35_RHIAP